VARYKVILEYDGSDFQGFQKQAQARTVQGVVESALRMIGWEGTSLLAAGRTDRGVHALGQVITCDLEWNHSLGDLLRALNSHLPPDVAVRATYRVSSDFHPRYCAQSRRYHYRLFCDETQRPLKERYAWRVWPEVDLEQMQNAAQQLHGTHDFHAFGSALQTGGSTIRTIIRAKWFEEMSDLVFEVVGNAFLYHMVRHLVFWQVLIGQGQAELKLLPELLAGKDLHLPQGLAPPGGLTLVEVLYPSDIGVRDSLG
jgi:tRNA pseudouridine38-40 synthase